MTKQFAERISDTYSPREFLAKQDAHFIQSLNLLPSSQQYDILAACVDKDISLPPLRTPEQLSSYLENLIPNPSVALAKWEAAIQPQAKYSYSPHSPPTRYLHLWHDNLKKAIRALKRAQCRVHIDIHAIMRKLLSTLGVPDHQCMSIYMIWLSALGKEATTLSSQSWELDQLYDFMDTAIPALISLQTSTLGELFNSLTKQTVVSSYRGNNKRNYDSITVNAVATEQAEYRKNQEKASNQHLQELRKMGERIQSMTDRVLSAVTKVETPLTPLVRNTGPSKNQEYPLIKTLPYLEGCLACGRDHHSTNACRTACFKCGTSGHLLRECKHPKCVLCNPSGDPSSHHDFRACPRMVHLLSNPKDMRS
jgi:hypothetical protein